MRVDGKSALGWTLCGPSYPLEHDQAVNICRYLINSYGSELDANHLDDNVLRICVNENYSDMVAYLAVLFGPDLNVENASAGTLVCLIRSQEEEVAEIYLDFHHSSIVDGSYDIIASAAHYSSAALFKRVLDMFGSQLTAPEANRILCELCTDYPKTDRGPNIRVAVGVLANKLTAETVAICLVNQWVLSHKTEDRTGMGTNPSLVAQFIVASCLDQISETLGTGTTCLHSAYLLIP